MTDFRPEGYAGKSDGYMDFALFPTPKNIIMAKELIDAATDLFYSREDVLKDIDDGTLRPIISGSSMAYVWGYLYRTETYKNGDKCMVVVAAYGPGYAESIRDSMLYVAHKKKCNHIRMHSTSFAFQRCYNKLFSDYPIEYGGAAYYIDLRERKNGK